MIVEKEVRSDEPATADAPPSYESAVSSFPLEKTQAASRSASSQPTTPTQGPQNPPQALSSGSKQVKRSSWYIFDRVQQARTAQQVKVTVVSLIRDVVKQAELDAFSTILQNCSEICKTYGIDFGELLREQSIEGHSPIYWAIIKHTSDGPSTEGSDLVRTLLRLAAPFNNAALSEIRLACLQNSDHAQFQRLKPFFSRLSGAEDILLGGSHPPDEIVVEEKAGGEGAFIARFHIAMFQKRMNISKDVKLEFIARGKCGKSMGMAIYLSHYLGRLWLLRFIVVKQNDRRTGFHYQLPGTWAVTLSLLEHSPPTAIDSRLLIEEPQDSDRALSEHLRDSSTPSTPTSSRSGRTTPKPTISLRLKSSSHLAPRQGHNHGDTIVVPLSESLMANSLQYAYVFLYHVAYGAFKLILRYPASPVIAPIYARMAP